MSIRSKFPGLDKWLIGTAILLMFPALLINLDINPLFTVNDEAIRILVAQEMYYSGDYITPTTFGEPYLRKPPLFNWMVLLSSEINGEFSEFSLRIISVLSLLLFTYLIYRFTSRHYGKKRGAIIALAVATNGRILFFDSFLGLIDITHGLIIFWSFMIIYHYDHKKKFWRLFLISYLLTAIAFLMKGLPAVVFQGITLLTFFLYKKNFRQLLSLAHFSGIALFGLIIGSYYLLYFRQNSLGFEDLFKVLLDQSTQRTGIEQGIGRTIQHIISFPFEFIYHFAPWTLMLVLFFRKGVRRKILKDPFLKFSALIFLANIIIYWLSPGAFARYFFMLLPLLFVLMFHFYFEEKENPKASWRVKVVEYGFTGMVILAAIGIPVTPFLSDFNSVNFVWLKTLLCLIPLIYISVLMFRKPSERMLLMVLALLFLRIGFDFFILPERVRPQQKYLDGVLTAAEASLGSDLFIYKDNYLLQEADVFYINKVRDEQLVRKSFNLDTNALYLVDDRLYSPSGFTEIYAYACKWYDRPIRVCRLKPGSEEDIGFK